MRIESAAMSHRKNQIPSIEARCKELGMSRSDFRRNLGGIDGQTYNNWKKRGIPANRLLDIAKLLKCDPDALRYGRIEEVPDPGLPMSVAENRPEYAVTLSDEALDVAHAFQELPDSIKRQIRTILDDYIVAVAPMLKSLYKNKNTVDQERFNRQIEEAQRRDKLRRSKKLI